MLTRVRDKEGEAKKSMKLLVDVRCKRLEVKKVDTVTYTAYNAIQYALKLCHLPMVRNKWRWSCDFSRIEQKKSKLKCTIKRSRPPPTGMRMNRSCAKRVCVLHAKYEVCKSWISNYFIWKNDACTEYIHRKHLLCTGANSVGAINSSSTKSFVGCFCCILLTEFIECVVSLRAWLICMKVL